MSTLRTSSSDEDVAQSPRKKKKIQYSQKFRPEWLSQKEFKDWLLPPPRDSKDPRCAVCMKSVSCHRSTLAKHMSSEGHIKNMKSKAANMCVKDVFQKQALKSVYKESTEVQVAAFLAEYNLPFTLANPLVHLIKSRAPKNSGEQAALQQLKMSDTKCSNIVRQGLGLYFAKELVTILRKTKFCVIPDEMTDVSTEKQLGVVVKFFDAEKMDVITCFFDLIRVENGTAAGLYEAIKESLIQRNIPLNNIIGYSSDTTNVMFGEHESVVSMLKKEIPHIVTVRCSCHLIHLCTSYACAKMSTSLEDMLKNTYAHFSRSFKRKKELQEFQEFCQVPIHNILNISQTRWLSLENVVNRVLEQWPALQLYFTEKVADKVDPSNTVKTILDAFNNNYCKAQLEFMSYQLHRVNAFNTLFQSSAPLLHRLQDEVTKLLKEMLCDFIKMDIVKSQDPFTLDIHAPQNKLKVENVYVGVAATATLSGCLGDNQGPQGVRHVRQTCQSFLVELVEQIRMRFSVVKHKSFDNLKFLYPVNAVKCQPASLFEVYKSFTFLEDVAPLQLVDSEWRKQGIEEDQMIKCNQSDMEFWKERLSLKSFSGDLKYKNLGKVVGCLMSLPFANAPVERLFSSLNLIKTDVRNSLKRESVVGLLHTKEGLAKYGKSAHELKLEEHNELLKLVKNVKCSATNDEAHQIIMDNFKI